MSLLIIIPVLNEEKNISPILNQINKLRNIKKDILFIDDNSVDNTRSNILISKQKYKNIFLLKRSFKKGIGSAHKEGIIWAYKRRYPVIITMDCDGTHDPIYIQKMLKLIQSKKYQIVSTNRFIKKNSLSGWSLWRKMLTNFRHILITKMLNMKYDSSGAYRCYDLKKVKIKDILKAKNDSYSFFWESMFFLSKKYRISEIPIHLPNRSTGSSKMKSKDIIGAFCYLCVIFFKHRF
tara:strand:- start:271 stop:978 length:708 start_codon:yes stop_codon:yes gene_type:complete